MQAFFTAGTAAVGWCADQPAIRANGISIISAPAASRTKAAARAIICGMKNSITSCGTRFRCMEEAEFVESIRQAQQEPYRVRRIERQIRQLTAEKAHTQGIKEKLYGDYAEEILTREDFLNYNELYSKRIEEYDRKITELEAEQRNLQTAPNAYPFLDVYRKYRKLEEITRPMVVELIEKIEVYDGNRVEITFRFQDEIADLLEELHQKQHEVSA